MTHLRVYTGFIEIVEIHKTLTLQCVLQFNYTHVQINIFKVNRLLNIIRRFDGFRLRFLKTLIIYQTGFFLRPLFVANLHFYIVM